MKLKFNTRIVTPALAMMSLALIGTVPGFADSASDPSGFLPTYAGPQNADLEILSADVSLDGSSFALTTTLAGPVGQTANGLYVFGFDTGDGTARFASIGETGVLFNEVVVLSEATDTAVLRDLINNTTTSLSDFSLSGATASAVVPVSDLVSEGFSPENFTWNIWTEFGGAGTNDNDLADFDPANSNAPVNSTPEPATMALIGTGLIGVSAVFRRRKAALEPL